MAVDVTNDLKMIIDGAAVGSPVSSSRARTTNRTVLSVSRSAVSRYLQLASLFRRRIEAGEWQVGQQIPTDRKSVV